MTNVRYTLTVYLTMPIDDDTDPQLTVDLDQRAKSLLERDVIRALKKLDGDADCEFMSAELMQDIL